MVFTFAKVTVRGYTNVIVEILPCLQSLCTFFVVCWQLHRMKHMAHTVSCHDSQLLFSVVPYSVVLTTCSFLLLCLNWERWRGFLNGLYCLNDRTGVWAQCCSVILSCDKAYLKEQTLLQLSRQNLLSYLAHMWGLNSAPREMLKIGLCLACVWWSILTADWQYKMIFNRLFDKILKGLCNNTKWCCSFFIFKFYIYETVHIVLPAGQCL